MKLDMNRVAIAKLAWHFFHEDDKMLARLLKSKYGDIRTSDFDKNFTSPFHTWPNLLEGYKVVREGWEWTVGNGRQCRFWVDSWLGDQKLLDVATFRISKEEERKLIHEYWSPLERWNPTVLGTFFQQKLLICYS